MLEKEKLTAVAAIHLDRLQTHLKHSAARRHSEGGEEGEVEGEGNRRREPSSLGGIASLDDIQNIPRGKFIFGQ